MTTANLFPIFASQASKRWLMAGASLMAAFCTLSVSGCGERAEGRSEDDVFLRTSQSGRQQVEYSATEPLLPVKIGDWWEYEVQSIQRTADGKTRTIAPYRERCTVAGSVAVNGQSATRFVFTRPGRNPRTATYVSNTNGVFFLGASDGQSTTLSSPLPIVQFPSTEGDYFSWDGRLDYGQNSTPARSCSRLTGQEKIKTPLGTFEAWRTDTQLEANLGGQAIRQLEIRWLAPGYGIVRHEVRTGNSLKTLVLVGCFKKEKRR